MSSNLHRMKTHMSKKHVETLAARIILEGKVREGDTIGLHVDAKTGGLVAEVEKTE